MSRTLTFDLGTSYFKVCVFDESLRLVARHSVAAPVVVSEPGRCELAVGEFDRSIEAAVQEVSRQAGVLRDVTRICFASQANTFTLLDDKDTPLIPFVSWSDQRARAEDAFARELSGSANFYRETGIAQVDHQFMVAKLRWLQLHSPAIVDRTHRVCTLSDYFVCRLTGNFLTEAGLAGLTGLVDIHRLSYRADALNQSCLSQKQLPAIVRAGSDAGPVRAEMIDAWGLAADCRLVMGCLDQYAGAIGAGIVSAGGVCETTGTVLATLRCTQHFEPQPADGVFQGPAFRAGLYYQLVFSSVSAGILERYRNGLPERPTFESLDLLAAKTPSGSDGLELNRDCLVDVTADMFVSRNARHRRGHEVRAIMEAVARELKVQVATICGTNWPTSIRSCGGASHSQVWLDIKREIVGCDFERVDSPEPTSLGAARIACGAISDQCGS